MYDLFNLMGIVLIVIILIMHMPYKAHASKEMEIFEKQIPYSL